LQKRTVHCGIVTQYELILFFTNTARQVYSKATETIFDYIDAPSFKKFHETVKGVNVSDAY